MSMGENNAKIAETEIASVTETDDEIETVYLNKKGIADLMDFPAVPEEFTGAEVTEAEEKSETPLKLSGMLTMNAPVLKLLGEDKPDDTDKDEIIQDIPDDSEDEPEESDEYSQKEKKTIAYVVYAEARGESFEGKVAVAQTIINRHKSGKFGKSIKKVVYARHQFAVSKRYNKQCMKAVEYAIENMPHPKNMYYFQVSKRKKWRNFVYYLRVGNHSFFCGKE